MSACPKCKRDDPRFASRYGPCEDGSYVCFRCIPGVERAASLLRKLPRKCEHNYFPAGCPYGCVDRRVVA